ncbi:aryl-alcohol dehydrogenase-like predicted oxidoreductase [Catenulispora sp. GAS73]|uniref:aldo/keto reductase n=1 Tax=Catenulispora sp. GAS73 TaxID=3156269 RepID=UPI003516A9F2
MHRVRLGTAGPTTSRLGLGCVSFGSGDNTCEIAAVVNRALDEGVTLFDVADPSAGGEGLQRVGRSVGARRADALIAAHTRPGPTSAQALVRECENTLRHLAMDHIDLYFLHAPEAVPAPATPLEEQIGVLAGLVQAGKIRYLGLFDPTGPDLVRAHTVHPVTALATEYSLAARQVEDDLLPLARELGIGVVACRPLGSGLLTGRVTEAQPERSPLLRTLRSLAAELDIGVSRLALAWLLSRGEDIVPVPGSADPVHLEMNLLSLDVVLPPEVSRRLSEISDGTEGASADCGHPPRPLAGHQS